MAQGSVEWIKGAGPVDYQAAVAAMERRVADIRGGRAGEAVWLLEHPALYTAGTSADQAEMLDTGGLPVFKTGRGGRMTYHGPGQRVAYVMLDLNRRGRDVRAFVSGLEDWLIAALATFGVLGERRPDRVGIWVARGGAADRREDKIAAIGVRVRHWITYHGIALNVDPDLGRYAGIVPCGIRGHGVTSLRDLGRDATLQQVDKALIAAFAEVFGDRSPSPSRPLQAAS